MHGPYIQNGPCFHLESHSAVHGSGGHPIYGFRSSALAYMAPDGSSPCFPDKLMEFQNTTEDTGDKPPKLLFIRRMKE